jgi:hypothetical protein
MTAHSHQTAERLGYTDEWLPIDDVANVVTRFVTGRGAKGRRVAQQYVRTLARKGRFPVVVVDGHNLYPKADVEAWTPDAGVEIVKTIKRDGHVRPAEVRVVGLERPDREPPPAPEPLPAPSPESYALKSDWWTVSVRGDEFTGLRAECDKWLEAKLRTARRAHDQDWIDDCLREMAWLNRDGRCAKALASRPAGGGRLVKGS